MVDDAAFVDEDWLSPAPLCSGNDNDVDGDTPTASVVTVRHTERSSANRTGTFTYTPAANFHGTDSFTYKASDGSVYFERCHRFHHRPVDQ